MLMGVVDPKKFAVVEVNQELKLVAKSAVLRIKEAEEKLARRISNVFRCASFPCSGYSVNFFWAFFCLFIVGSSFTVLVFWDL